MTHQILHRDRVVAKLFELKNRAETARYFAVSKETLNRRLKEWGVETSFKPKATQSTEILSAGDLVIWEPKKAREGFFGHQLGKAPIECVVISGPSKDDTYRIKTISLHLKSKDHLHEVRGSSLRKINPLPAGQP